jgi:beta-glucanase (GH16 family)
MSTILSTPFQYSANDLVFNDCFLGFSLDASAWNTYLTSGFTAGAPSNATASGGSGEFGGGSLTDAEYFMPSQVTVDNGLVLNAILQSVEGATTWYGVQYPATFPVTSGVVSSYGKFEFDGGYLQISMKQPAGDGAWPGLWLLPGQGAGNGGDSFEIDIQEGGTILGSDNPNDILSGTLHTGSASWGFKFNTGIDLSATYNTYAINWIPGVSITWYFNGQQVFQITSAQATIPNEPMELIMSNQVAPSTQSSWHSILDSSTPQSMQMQIADVQLYQLPGSGDFVLGANVPKTMDATASAAESVSGLTSQTSEAITVTATAESVGGDSITTVAIYDGTHLLGDATANGNGTWSYTATGLADGSHAFSAQVTDAAGNATTTPVLPALTVATHAPTASAEESVSGLTSQTTETITVTATVESVGGDSITTVAIYDGAHLLGDATANGNGTWSYTASGLAVGSHAFSAQVTDAAGNATTTAVLPVLSVATTVVGFLANQSQLDRTPAGFAILDSATNVVGSLDALNADTHITSITLTDPSVAVLTLTVAQDLNDAAVLSKITGPYKIAMSDSASDIGAITLARAAALKVAGVTTINATGPVTLSTAEAAILSGSRLKIAGARVTVTGSVNAISALSTSQTAAYVGQGYSLAIVDTAANIHALNKTQLQALAQRNVTSVAASNGGVTLTTAEAGLLAIAKIHLTAPAGDQVVVADTAAKLQALQTSLVALLPTIGVNELYSTNANVSYTAEQTAAIISAGLSLAARGSDTVTENFANGDYSVFTKGVLSSQKSVNGNGSYDIAAFNVAGRSCPSDDTNYNAAGVKVDFGRDDTNGTGALTLYASDENISAGRNLSSVTVRTDVFALDAHASETMTGRMGETFAFAPYLGDDAIAGFWMALLAHTALNGAGGLVSTDIYGDRATLLGMSEAPLTAAANAGDFKFI